MENLSIALVTTLELQSEYFEQQRSHLVLTKPYNVLIPHIRGTGNIYNYEKPEFKSKYTANVEYGGK
jgi:hypothetical protein